MHDLSRVDLNAIRRLLSLGQFRAAVKVYAGVKKCKHTQARAAINELKRQMEITA